MKKTAYFFIDDVIFTMRSIARNRPASLFDDPFMKVLKNAHDAYGMTIQLNLFYRTDFFYGSDEFTLAEMPDCYKPEFEANAHWLKLAFHAKQEFPDYPYLNADYDDVKRDFYQIKNEVVRFAGEAVWSCAVIPHWLPISKDGCRALADCGVRFISPSHGERKPYNATAAQLLHEGDPAGLPYGHGFRLLQNRKPESMLYDRGSSNQSIANSICAWNHVSTDVYESLYNRNASVEDPETGIRFRLFGGGPTLNLTELDVLEQKIRERVAKGGDHIGIGNHEQYFYSDYFFYQPDYADKIMTMAKTLTELGYTFITAEEFE